MITKMRDRICWNGRLMVWTEGDAIHFDAAVYAECRGISVDQAVKELEQMGRELLPDASFHECRMPRTK